MKTKQTLTRLIMAVTFLFGISMASQAQLGGLVNAAKGALKTKSKSIVRKQKEKVQNEVWRQTHGRINEAANNAEEAVNKAIEKRVNSAKETVMSKATSKAVAKFVGDAPELPALMGMAPTQREYDATDLAHKELVWDLRVSDQEEIKALAEQLKARTDWNMKVRQGMANKKIPKDEKLRAQIDNEINNLQNFYGNLTRVVTLFAPIEMKQDKNGMWYSQGEHMLHAALSMSGVDASRKHLGNVKIILFKNKGGGKGVFIDVDGNARFLEEEELAVAKMDLNLMKNANALLRAFVDDWGAYVQEWNTFLFDKNGPNDCVVAYNRSAQYNAMLQEAINGNSIENLEFKPMPKAGKLNASLKAKALSIAKGRSKDVVNVVITRDAWDVKKNALGVPTCRVAYGYQIVTTKHGKMAVPVSWAQDHMGGGKYGALRHYGVGVGGTFYVK